MITSQDFLYCFTKGVIELIIQNTRLLITVLKYGIIFLQFIEPGSYDSFKSTIKKYFLQFDYSVENILVN